MLRSLLSGCLCPHAGKKSPPAEDKVVLTHMKILSNEGIQNPGLVPEAPADAACTEEPHLPSTNLPRDCQGNPNATTTTADTDYAEAPAGADYVATLPDLSSFESKCRLHRFSKFESEDSGVELPSGANSPSTPTGSEKSFVLHSRDSFCDSGVLSTSSSPEIDHLIMRACKERARKVGHQGAESEKQAELYSQESDVVQVPTPSLEDFSVPQEGESPDERFDQSERQPLEKEPSPETNPPTESTVPTPVPIEEPKTIADNYTETFGSTQDLQFHEHQLKKYPTSDSLDEYMNECCRLSEVNQGNSKALGSGLGYLEHICQLIEKIGQLQEHNLRLQKQVCSLQKEQKMSQIKEEYLMQHCSCGAASVFLNSYQDVKTFSAGRSRPHSLLVQTGNPSDLSIIPEIGANTDKLSSYRGSERYPESGNSHPMAALRKSSNNRNKENEFREGGGVAERQAFPPKDPAARKGLDTSKNCLAESHAWGRMRDLVKKTRLRNQSRLGLSSAALKRSCPQLYRPDNTSSELRKAERTERNSMIVLGQNTKNENIWPF
ncbi:uncharacterized protein LOC423752 isoform X2 [Gallus gallus]|uniref:uncharacterized protein LOC423752 isoform X2 n=1 Tax=Gallus gallus TaxID=9031 RepID=UPI001AE9C3E5|nr:uncharacterized protein LOC423752 isoform X2 [Gallus gallus]XP_040530587.1 uncharacterized protein LOC423752 isoform X2 [Gallus gallus]XP_040530588.1 uncharacterized protein LOC423752 isoform X2 [Gallus gallus]XP_040558726.1 uncharacterized protein LOC423752 isoform X2 [Gallus gallus]